MNTQELRDAFQVSLFEPGALNLLYCEVERGVVGAAVPTDTPLVLEAGSALAANCFCERREVGILNIGGGGSIVVDGTEHDMDRLDCLYIGRGAREVSFHSQSATHPARFHLISYPAHTDYPTRKMKQSEATTLHLGSEADANKRTIFQYIHEKGIPSCQLVMGFTTLDQGSVWNTMPCHTHERRTEVYLYFDLDPAATVFHFMGPSDETRHLTMANEQAVISPLWSIHAGCGTQAYSFCWAMGGENQRFDDMDHIPINQIK